jgi:hypothetical protein
MHRWWEEFIKHFVEMGSGASIYTRLACVFRSCYGGHAEGKVVSQSYFYLFIFFYTKATRLKGADT